MANLQELVRLAEPYYGVWTLQPEQSQYEFGAPPLQATYYIQPEGDGLRFRAEWTTPDGEPLEMEYHSIPDGEPRPSEHPAVSVSTTLTSSLSLDTASIRNNIVIGLARREVSSDGSRMTITQSGTAPDGTWFNNVAVYTKQFS